MDSAAAHIDALFYEILANPPPNPVTTPFQGRRLLEVIHRMGLRTPSEFA
jgi:hypothetical protein